MDDVDQKAAAREKISMDEKEVERLMKAATSLSLEDVTPDLMGFEMPIWGWISDERRTSPGVKMVQDLAKAKVLEVGYERRRSNGLLPGKEKDEVTLSLQRGRLEALDALRAASKLAVGEDVSRGKARAGKSDMVEIRRLEEIQAKLQLELDQAVHDARRSKLEAEALQVKTKELETRQERMEFDHDADLLNEGSGVKERKMLALRLLVSINWRIQREVQRVLILRWRQKRAKNRAEDLIRDRKIKVFKGMYRLIEKNLLSLEKESITMAIKTIRDDYQEEKDHQMALQNLIRALKPVVHSWLIRKRMRQLVMMARQVKCPDLKKTQTRIQVLREILSSEESYVKLIYELLNLFLLPTRDMIIKSSFGWGTPRQREDYLMFTCSVEEMCMHHTTYLATIKESTHKVGKQGSVASVFTKISHSLRTSYLTYLNRMTGVRMMLETKMKKDKEFAKFIRSQSTQSKTGQGLGFAAFLISPLQRLVAYGLLLERLVATTPAEDEQLPGLNEALRLIQEAQNAVNGNKAEFVKLMMLQRSLRGCDFAIVAEGRKLLKESQVASVRSSSVPFRTYSLTEDILKLYLMNDLLLIAKPVEEHGLETVSFQVEHAVLPNEISFKQPESKLDRSEEMLILTLQASSIGPELNSPKSSTKSPKSTRRGRKKASPVVAPPPVSVTVRFEGGADERREWERALGAAIDVHHSSTMTALETAQDLQFIMNRTASFQVSSQNGASISPLRETV